MPGLRRHLLVFLLYLGVAVLFTWPLVMVLGTHFAGYPFGDSHEMTRHLWWFTHALRTGAPLIDQPLLGYPDGLPGVILWSNPLQFFPGWLLALALPLPAAYNLQALLNLALNGWAAWWLVRCLLADDGPPVSSAPLLAGLIFMLAPTLQGHLAGGHGGLLVQWPMPLLALSLWRVLADRPHPDDELRTYPEKKGLTTEAQRSQRVQDFEPPSYSEASLSRQDRQVVQSSYPRNTNSTQQRNESRLPVPLSQPSAAIGRGAGGEGYFQRSYSRTGQAIALVALFTFLTPLGHTLQLIYAVLPLTGTAALTLLFQRRWGGLAQVMAGVGLGTAALAVFLLPVWGAGTETQAYIDAGGSVAYSMDVLGPATPSFAHPLWGQMEYTHRVLGTNIVEGFSYVGLLAGGLALIGVWRAPVARWWLLPLALCTVGALGPLLKLFDQPVSLMTGGYASYIPLPWALLADVPGFDLTRTPGRFNFVMALAVAVLAGYGLRAILSPQRRGGSSTTPAHSAAPPAAAPTGNRQPAALILERLLPFLIGLLLALDYQAFWPLPTYAAGIPQAVADLRGRDDVRAVFDVPWDNLLAAKDALWLQTAHQKPLIAGQVTRQTPVSPARLAILQATLDPALLRLAGADVVIVHKQYLSGSLVIEPAATLGSPFYEDERLALYAVPEGGALPPGLMLGEGRRNQLSQHFFAPAPGWVLATAHPPRSIAIRWQGQPVSQQDIPAEGTAVNLLLPVTGAGFYDLSLTLDPVCPAAPYPLTCPDWEPGLTRAEDVFQAAEPLEPVAFANGVTLGAAYIPARLLPDGDTAWNQIGLWWLFEAPPPPGSIRFVKLLDSAGAQVVGWDDALPPISGAMSDVLPIPPDVLTPGVTYQVCVGWYTLPEVARVGVLSAVEGAADGLACIGAVVG